MLNFFREKFPRSSNYLLKLSGQLEIDNLIIEALVNQAPEGHHKRNLWGDTAGRLPLIGRDLGWVPSHFTLTFFSESVEQEIANSFVGKVNLVQGSERELHSARILLRHLGIESLAKQNPFSLSEGESKLVWFLCQWAKAPDFFLMGYMPGSLSEQKIESLVSFILKSNDISKELDTSSPTFLLGYINENETWHQRLLNNGNWKIINNFLNDVKKIKN